LIDSLPIWDDSKTKECGTYIKNNNRRFTYEFKIKIVTTSGVRLNYRGEAVKPEGAKYYKRVLNNRVWPMNLFY
jgi:hypothetical protein